MNISKNEKIEIKTAYIILSQKRQFFSMKILETNKCKCLYNFVLNVHKIQISEP